MSRSPTKAPNRWLDRELTRCSYHYTLCLSQEEFTHLARLNGMDNPPAFVSRNGHATTHFYTPGNPEHPSIAFVCMPHPHPANPTPIQVAALLCHEAVHIWQKHAAYIGSWNDHGDEEEAYAIQNIAQALMEEYARRT